MRSSITVKNTKYEIGEKFASGGQATIFRVRDNPLILVKEYCPSFAERDINGVLSACSEIWKYRLQSYVGEISAAEKRATAFCIASHQSQFCAWEFDPEHMTSVMRKAPSDCKTLTDILIEWESKPPKRSNYEASDLQRIRQSVEIIHSLLSAVDSLHQANLLHLDLSPGNIIWGENRSAGAGTAYLIDLACNQLIGTPASKCRESSPGYTAPEVLRGGNTELTEAADLYSVGALLLVLCCGRNAAVSNWEVRKLPGQGNINVKDPVSKLDVPKSVRDGLIHIIVKATTRLGDYYGMHHQGQNGLSPTEEMLQDLKELEEKCRPMIFPLQRGLPGMLDTGRFQGRQKESWELLKYLDGGQKSVYVWGDGGLGKTEFMITFATRNERKYNWHYTTFQGDIRKTVLGLKFDGWSTERITLPGKREIKTEEEQYEEKLNLLAKYDSNTVLIIDNYDGDPKQLLEDEGLERLNELDIRIVYTTRNYFRGESGVQIRPMETEELLRLMQYYLQGVAYSEDDLKALIEQVERNTLVVDIIARLMSGSIRPLSANELLEKLKKSAWNDKLLSKQVFSDYNQKKASRTVLGHLQTLFDISGLREEAAYVMSCACMIPENGVDAVLFLECMDDADEVVENLRDTGWLKQDKVNNLIRIHPLIRTVCFHSETVKPSYPEIKPFWEKLLSCKKEKAQWEQIGEILQNLLNCLEQHIPPKLWAQTQNVLTDVDYNMCRYISAKERAEKLHEYLQEKLPDAHGAFVDNCINLGVVCSEMSMNYAAAGYYKKALDHWEKLADDKKDPEDQADLYIRLATAQMYDYPQFIVSETLQMALKLLPEQSRKHADYYDAQGLFYQEMKDYQKAHEYFCKALQIRQDILSLEDSDFIYSYGYIGMIQNDIGNYPEAIRNLEKSLQIQKKHDAENSLNLAVTYYNLGSSWFKMQDYSNSLKNYCEALRIYTAVLPKYHPDLATVHCWVGVCFGKLQNWKQCLQHLQIAIDIAESTGSSNHSGNDSISEIAIGAYCNRIARQCLSEMRGKFYSEYSDYDIEVVKLLFLEGRYCQLNENWKMSQYLYTKALLKHEIRGVDVPIDQQLVFELNMRLGRIYYELADALQMHQVDNQLDDYFGKYIELSQKYYGEAFAYWKNSKKPMDWRILSYFMGYGSCNGLAGKWNEAADIFFELVDPDVPLRTLYDSDGRYAILCGKAIECCGKAGRWKECIIAFNRYQSLPQELQQRIFKRDMLLYYAGVACQRMGEHERALEFLLQCEQHEETEFTHRFGWVSDWSKGWGYSALSEVYGSLGNSEQQQRYAALADEVSQNKEFPF